MNEKLVIFDLDGVLVDSKDIHFRALNRAISLIDPKYIITKEEHLEKYDGLPTVNKLKLLTKEKNLPFEFHESIYNLKQKETAKLFNLLKEDLQLIEYCQFFKENNIKLAVASNCTRTSLKTALFKLGIIDYIDYYVSSEDVLKSKPFPEIYWKCMTVLNSLPENTVIFEDSVIGRKGALNSKANLIPIENRKDLTKNKINNAFDILNKNKKPVKWNSENLNIVIPMAGQGSRFLQNGYKFPKPLIDVNGKPMIQLVVENLNIDAQYIFLVQKEHCEKFNLKHLLNLISPKCIIIEIDGLTEGAACTTLLAKELINNDNPLLIVNSDQYIEWNSSEVLYSWTMDQIDGGILTFSASDPKWSYVKTNSENIAIKVAEKEVISSDATVGIYYWKKGKDYIKYAEQMISKNIRVNGEFYICPVYNESIQDGFKIKTKKVKKMYGLGTPDDLTYFIQNFK